MIVANLQATEPQKGDGVQGWDLNPGLTPNFGSSGDSVSWPFTVKN